MAEPHLSHLLPMNASAVRAVQQEAAEEYAVQVESEEDLSQYFQLATFNPMQRMGQFKELHELRSQSTQKKEKTEEEGEVVETKGVEAIEEIAERYQGGNYELNKKTLLILRDQIEAGNTAEEMLEKVNKIYPDASLADEALDFLIEAPLPETSSALQEAKALLQARAGREVRAGRNIGQWAREFSQTGLGSPTALRDLYRDITGTARPPLDLFNELTEKFLYVQLRPTIEFLLHSMGSDLRAKGSSIPRGELKRLIDEIKSLQGILGVFRFFQSRIGLMQKLFAGEKIPWPKILQFEGISKVFIRILAEKFINADKILQTAKQLGLDTQIAAQLIVYRQMQEGLRQITPRYFRTPTHKDELLRAYLLAIDELEDQYEEEQEKKGQKKKRKKEP